ncbi:hypothetical protein TELCIR_08974 [Teladorsagia circumcincta]|uniref:SHSP domain-containing protein n=1 Tax=Teladorsagia circumcincta TaxID=45464 RepID=A0A2G9UG45_TELCI|nr:hypothetical protein TELCIR_08974 [Teladorsagia circumcincta]
MSSLVSLPTAQQYEKLVEIHKKEVARQIEESRMRAANEVVGVRASSSLPSMALKDRPPVSVVHERTRKQAADGMETGKVLENVRTLGNRIFSCWSEEEASSVSEEDKNVINNDTKFSVSVDVSNFKPDELRVHINGRELIIEGNQEKQDGVGYVQR